MKCKYCNREHDNRLVCVEMNQRLSEQNLDLKPYYMKNQSSPIIEKLLTEFRERFVEEDKYQTGVVRIDDFIPVEDLESFLISKLQQVERETVDRILFELIFTSRLGLTTGQMVILKEVLSQLTKEGE